MKDSWSDCFSASRRLSNFALASARVASGLSDFIFKRIELIAEIEAYAPVGVVLPRVSTYQRREKWFWFLWDPPGSFGRLPR